MSKRIENQKRRLRLAAAGRRLLFLIFLLFDREGSDTAGCPFFWFIFFGQAKKMNNYFIYQNCSIIHSNSIFDYFYHQNIHMLLEIAAFSLEAALAASASKAQRIELCSCYSAGGLTPSAGTLRIAAELIEKDVFVMLRPREGDFCYSNREFDSMIEEIRFIKSLGFKGIVSGILHTDGSIDKSRTRKLVDAAFPMSFTFHRAFDKSRNLTESLEDIIDCGCTRVLTSGGKSSVNEGLQMIKSLVDQAAGRIIILPGGGVNLNNVLQLKDAGCNELHLSARHWVNSAMIYKKAEPDFGSGVIPDFQYCMPDIDLINEISRKI